MVEQYSEKTLFFVSHGDPIAFLGWVLLHPGENMPVAIELEHSLNYPQKGEAWKIIINEKMQASGFEKYRSSLT
jgi:hypothetical protein